MALPSSSDIPKQERGEMEMWDEEYHTELETIGPLRTVYHALPHCPVGRRIPAELRRNGRGDQVEICPACEARLNARRWLDPEPDDLGTILLGGPGYSLGETRVLARRRAAPSPGPEFRMGR
jgi:hypothetical protein